LKKGSKALYSHASKAGNRADLWKHFVLLTAADLLLKRGGPSNPFRYLETHCGLPLHFLRPGGNWKKGIGALRPLPRSLILHPYFETIGVLGGAILFYPSSWLQVGTFLSVRGVPMEMCLCDISAEVFTAMRAMGVGNGGGVINFLREDGFEVLGRDKFWDLVLVDAPFWPDYESDYLRCTRALVHLRSRSQVFLVWYPLIPGKAGKWNLDSGERLVEIHWEREEPSSMCGCGVLIGGMGEEEFRATLPLLEELAKAVGGDLQCHSISP
jgi:23S rRNA A2030 N6-methylase RlmJ